MGSRKRSKPNPKAEAAAETQARPKPKECEPEIQGDSSKLSRASLSPIDSTDPKTASVAEDRTDISQTIKAWYGGTWPRVTKAASITQVVKEGASASANVDFDVSASAPPQTPQNPQTVQHPPLRSPTVYLSRNIGSSSRSLPLAATTTKLNITSNVSIIPSETQKPKNDEQSLHINLGANQDQVVEKSTARTIQEEESIKNSIPPKLAGRDLNPAFKNTPRGGDSSGWLGWFSKPTPLLGDGESASSRDGQTAMAVSDQSLSLGSAHSQPGLEQRRSSDPNPVAAATPRDVTTRSWLSLWGNAAATTAPEKSTPTIGSEIAPATPATETTEVRRSVQAQGPPTYGVAPASGTSVKPSLTTKSYGWAFWSKEHPEDNRGETVSKNIVGKLALAGSGSQSKPEIAMVDETGGLLSKLELPQPRGKNDTVMNSGGLKVEVGKKTSSKAAVAPPKVKAEEHAGASFQKPTVNLLLPSFKRTYRFAEKPSLLQQLGQLLQYSQLPNARHVNRVPDPPHIKRAMAIGVHGYFPAPLIRSVLGQPTGTSIRFANCAAGAIQRWTHDHGYSCTIEKVALEGEGKIAERIELLWKLMLNWIEEIRKADFVMIACHSQGVPVAIILVAKLIAFGCVNTSKIGVCAMAGVNLGPFVDYKSRWIGGSAGELFDFAWPTSQVSKDYEAALDVALRFGVKIVYVGSLDDQLVSLESSTFGPISHPYIYRAVFVDGRVNAPDFLTHLVGLLLKLRNLGVSDHGLIRELSSPLAGSLYGGEGHSRIYDDQSVYYLAVQHALETTSLGDLPIKIQREGSSSQNPYILPFAMRGLLEEDYVRNELKDETMELLRQFDEWKPSSKVLKDVKFRLEGVRSKL